MKYRSFLNTRHLTTRFIPLAAVLVVAGGVFCLIPVLAVMEGFKTEMRSHIRGSLSHLSVVGRGYISLYDELGVQAALDDFVLYDLVIDRAVEKRGLDASLERMGFGAERVRDLAKYAGEYYDLELGPMRSDGSGVGSTLEIPTREEFIDRAKRERLYRSLADTGLEESLSQLDLPDDPRYRPIEASAPYVEATAVFKSGVLSTCSIRGIEPAEEAKVGEFLSYLLRDDEIESMLRQRRLRLPKDRKPFTVEEAEHLFSPERREEVRKSFGTFEEDEAAARFEQPQPIVVGIEALRNGRFQMGLNTELTTYSPIDDTVRNGKFIVVGAFQTNVYELDIGLVYMPMGPVGNFLGLYDPTINDNRLSGFAVKLHDYELAEKVRNQINQFGIGPIPPEQLRARTWEEERSTLLQAVDTEKRIISAMMLLIVAFAGVVIFLILTVMVIEKTRDLGVLRSLGATRRGVVLLFLRTGMILCITGTTLGAIAGWAFTDNINTIHDWLEKLTGRPLFPPNIYYLTEIPVAHNWGDWALVLLPSILCGFLASLIPAIWAANRDPVKALRHE